MATTRDSTLYTSRDVNKYLQDARDYEGRAVPIYFAHTVVTGETGGASAGTQDLVNLCTLPANVRVVGMSVSHEALGASAGSGVLADIGDSGDPDRYAAGKDVDAAGNFDGLAFAGMGYKPTADTIVQFRWRTANPVVGKKIAGVIFVVPGA